MSATARTEVDPVVSRRMASVSGKNTGPELRVRRLLRGMGYGYRLHVKALPGHPDIVLRKRGRAVIEVRGCFWHMHECANCRLPRSNVEFWQEKLLSNRARDERNKAALEDLGWRVLVLWECELGDDEALMQRLRAFLEDRPE